MRKQFLRESTIVFDGYPIIPATKKQTQACTEPEINFSATSLLSVSKAVFPSNLINKQAFINLLADSF